MKKDVAGVSVDADEEKDKLVRHSLQQIPPHNELSIKMTGMTNEAMKVVKSASRTTQKSIEKITNIHWLCCNEHTVQDDTTSRQARDSRSQWPFFFFFSQQHGAHATMPND